jgi:integrase
MPALVSGNTGMPVFAACVYAMTEVRPRSGSPATIEQALRGVQFLLAFADLRGIDLQERFANARFLDLHELDDLATLAHLPLHSRDNGRQEDASAARTMPPSVAVSTAAIRLHYSRAYLSWLGQTAASRTCATLEQRATYMAILREFLARLIARAPSARSSTHRAGLDAQARAVLLQAIDPASAENPWSTGFLRDRNRLLALWGLGTGLRRGELLGLRIRGIDFRRNMADVVRRPDDKTDPRINQPNTKTRERSIGISEELAYLTHQHIVQHRARIAGARRHDFLFVTAAGDPLSLSAVTKIFQGLRRHHPQLGDAFSSHVLRHTWNEDFSEIADRAGMKPGDERRARNHAMGWSESSRSAETYLYRRTRRLAAQASVEIQRKVLGEEVSRDA